MNFVPNSAQAQQLFPDQNTQESQQPMFFPTQCALPQVQYSNPHTYPVSAPLPNVPINNSTVAVRAVYSQEFGSQVLVPVGVVPNHTPSPDLPPPLQNLASNTSFGQVPSNTSFNQFPDFNSYECYSSNDSITFSSNDSITFSSNDSCSQLPRGQLNTPHTQASPFGVSNHFEVVDDSKMNEPMGENDFFEDGRPSLVQNFQPRVSQRLLSLLKELQSSPRSSIVEQEDFDDLNNDHEFGSPLPEEGFEKEMKECDTEQNVQQEKEFFLSDDSDPSDREPFPISRRNSILLPDDEKALTKHSDLWMAANFAKVAQYLADVRDIQKSESSTEGTDALAKWFHFAYTNLGRPYKGIQTQMSMQDTVRDDLLAKRCRLLYYGCARLTIKAIGYKIPVTYDGSSGFRLRIGGEMVNYFAKIIDHLMKCYHEELESVAVALPELSKTTKNCYAGTLAFKVKQLSLYFVPKNPELGDRICNEMNSFMTNTLKLMFGKKEQMFVKRKQRNALTYKEFHQSFYNRYIHISKCKQQNLVRGVSRAARKFRACLVEVEVNSIEEFAEKKALAEQACPESKLKVFWSQTVHNRKFSTDSVMLAIICAKKNIADSIRTTLNLPEFDFNSNRISKLSQGPLLNLDEDWALNFIKHLENNLPEDVEYSRDLPLVARCLTHEDYINNEPTAVYKLEMSDQRFYDILQKEEHFKKAIKISYKYNPVRLTQLANTKRFTYQPGSVQVFVEFARKIERMDALVRECQIIFREDRFTCERCYQCLLPNCFFLLKDSVTLRDSCRDSLTRGTPI